MKTEHSLDLPRRLQIDFSQVIQRHTDDAGGEVDAEKMWSIFEQEYLFDSDATFALTSFSSADDGDMTRVDARVRAFGKFYDVTGVGNGPINAFCQAVSEPDMGLGGVGLRVLDYSEHALTTGGDAEAAAYLEIEVGDRVLWGVGISESIVGASLRAVMSGVNRIAREITG